MVCIKAVLLLPPNLFVGLLGLRGLISCCREGLTIPVIATAVQGVVELVGTAMGFATLAKLLTASLLRDSTSRPPRCLPLGITLGKLQSKVLAVGFAMLAKLLTVNLLRDLITQAPRRFPLGITFCFALSFSFCFSTMTRSIASRSGSSARNDLGSVRWVRFYWFCHVIGMDASTIAARSASPKGVFPFFIIGTALGLSFNVGRYLT
jgi:hypothetical protein